MPKTVSGSWVRLTVPTAEQIKKAIFDITGRKSDAIKNHPELRYNIGLKYAEIVKPYVPYSGLDKTHHLNQAYVTNDGRIIWTAVHTYKKNSSDDEDNNEDVRSFNYAQLQYTNPNFKHSSRYDGHKPQCRWTDAVQPSTDGTDRTGDWENIFIPAITPLIVEEFENA